MSGINFNNTSNKSVNNIDTNPSTSFQLQDDFLFSVLSNDGTQIWRKDVVSGTVESHVSLPNHPGIIEIATGSDETGQGSLSTYSDSLFIFGAGILIGEWLVNIPTLSTISEEYVFSVGFSSESFGTSISNGALIFYDRLNWGGNFWSYEVWNSDGPGYQQQTSIVPVTTGWHKFKIVGNANGTLVTFYVDDIIIGTHSTEIPTVNPFRSTISIEKYVGTSSRSILVDYCNINYKVTR